MRALGAVPAQKTTSLRRRILTFVGAFTLLSLLASTISVFRITEVNRLLDAINRVSVPLGRIVTQMQSDADILRREMERGLGIAHWKDPHWKPRPIPRWIEDVLEGETDRVQTILKNDADWANPEEKARWREWAAQISTQLASLRAEASKLFTALDQRDDAKAAEIYPHWSASAEEWRRQLQWGALEYERSLRQTFSQAQSRVSELRTGLETILVVVVGMSLLLLWLGERALRPLADLTQLAREITRRGLRKEDKALLPEIPLSRSDEVSHLAREFHTMATALLERERTVESQKHRLQEQNRLLREIGELNENILHSIDSILVVTNLEGEITQCNPVAARWLGKPAAEILGSSLVDWAKLAQFVQTKRVGVEKVGPSTIEGRVFGGQWLPLKQDGGGAILVLDDLTDDLDLQERLRRAENLAAVGRMSAQVAHEVRNPLHAIGLEAEMAMELASRVSDPAIKQSLQSILNSVDRLDKITENYLKLSRLSAGLKRKTDLGEILETVLATYTPVCEEQGISVDWTREGSSFPVLGDAESLEQSLGNLFRNSLQAIESGGKIHWTLGLAESGRVWIRIEDNGPGIAPEIRDRLFTPFLTTKAQGTGLGLSFVKKVIEEHGGTIECLPREKGACFEIRLPSNFEADLESSSRRSVEEVSWNG